jgi:hypothetical protein
MDDQQSPDSPRGSCMSAVVSLIGIALSLLFLANLSFGLLEIPDNLPIVGNIDEVFVTGVLIACLSRFGIHLAPNFDPRRKLRK